MILFLIYLSNFMGKQNRKELPKEEEIHKETPKLLLYQSCPALLDALSLSHVGSSSLPPFSNFFQGWGGEKRADKGGACP